MAKIGIVTVLYNSASVLADYFKTLSEQTYKDFVLYVIDNKSPDESLLLSYKYAEQYKNCYKTIIIENHDNLGVAAGNNRGVTAAQQDGCDYILLSNNDVVLKNDCIQILLESLLENNVDMIVPKILFYDEPLIWCAGGKYKLLSGTTAHYGYKLPDNGNYNEYRLCGYAPTCFMLIRTSTFQEIGLFDEKYFVYYDDTDWVYRCKVARKKLAYEPSALMWHKESTSTGGMMSNFYLHYNTRNKYYFCKKHFSTLHLWLTIAANITYYYLRRRQKYSKDQHLIIKKSFKDGLSY